MLDQMDLLILDYEVVLVMVMVIVEVVVNDQMDWLQVIVVNHFLMKALQMDLLSLVPLLVELEKVTKATEVGAKKVRTLGPTQIMTF